MKSFHCPTPLNKRDRSHGRHRQRNEDLQENVPIPCAVNLGRFFQRIRDITEEVHENHDIVETEERWDNVHPEAVQAGQVI
jgi:hypothetical protein